MNFQVTLGEAEEKYNPKRVSCAHLEIEISDVISQVNKLRSSVQRLGEDLSEVYKKCDEITSVSAKICTLCSFFRDNVMRFVLHNELHNRLCIFEQISVFVV